MKVVEPEDVAAPEDWVDAERHQVTVSSAGVGAGTSVVGGPPAGTPEPRRGTRKRLDHIDAMRPVKQVGVVSTHTLLAFAPVAAGLSANAALLLLHVTREAFLFVSACMITYSYGDLRRIDRSYWQRRLVMIGLPYLCWTLIYFALMLPSSSRSFGASLGHLGYLAVTGYYQLYYLVVLAEFYVVFPLLLLLLRRTARHHLALLVVSGFLQTVLVSLMYWRVLPKSMEGFWATREITSYQFYLLAGMVVALHLRDIHDWLCRNARLIVGLTLASAALAEASYYLAAEHVVSWLGSNSSPFQPVVIPWNIGAIACIYLIGVALVDPGKSLRVRAVVKSGSDNAYGVYLAQMVFIMALGWLGWQRLNHLFPWPIVSILSVALVFLASVALTALLARTPLARPLTGRSRVRWTAKIRRPWRASFG